MQFRANLPVVYVLVLGWAFWSIGCSQPDADLFEPPERRPEEVSPGVFRLTANSGPDVVRGFSPDGSRVVYWSSGLFGFGEGTRILSVSVEGGVAREEASIYRRALSSPVGAFTWTEDFRLLTLWREPTPPVFGGCVDCFEIPVAQLVVLSLESTDGAPLSAIPSRNLTLQQAPVRPSPFLLIHFIEYDPALQEVDAGGANPFGPSVIPGSQLAVISDGRSLWTIDLKNPAVPPDSVGPGIYPSVSPDGRHVAAAVPMRRDISVSICETEDPFSLATCRQVTQQVLVREWGVVTYGLVDGSVDTVAVGTEPVFHPDGDKILVRREGGIIVLVSAADGAELEVFSGTVGAYSIAVSPDGSAIAFSSTRSGSPDVYVAFLDGAP